MRRLAQILLGPLLWVLLPAVAQANTVTIPGAVCALFPAGCQGGGALRLDAIITQNGLFSLQIGFVALMVGMLFYYAVTLITSSINGDESALRDSKSAFAYAIAGAAVASFSVVIVAAFQVGNAASPLPNYSVLQGIFGSIYLFFKVALGVALTANIVLQAFRLITSQGSDELITRARKRLIAGFLGVGVVLLANAFIVSVDPSEQGVTPASAIREIAGVVNFLLTLTGAITLGALIIAGLLLMISVEESLKDKAKQIIRTSLITLLLILTSFVIVNLFIAFQ